MRVSKSALTLAAVGAVAGCAGTTGIYPVGPGVWSVSEMRAPALGGGAEAQRVALLEASGFCGVNGMQYSPVASGPGGFPGSPYGPVSFTVSFTCIPPGAPPPPASAPPPPAPPRQG
jgi:hypothetical protein